MIDLSTDMTIYPVHAEACGHADQVRSFFLVVSRADPQAVPRILEHFALRDLTPSRVFVERQGDHLRLEITCDALDRHTSRCIAEKMRSTYLVRDVEHSCSELPGVC